MSRRDRKEKARNRKGNEAARMESEKFAKKFMLENSVKRHGGGCNPRFIANA